MTDDGLHGNHETSGTGSWQRSLPTKPRIATESYSRNAMDLEEKELNMRRDRRGHPSAFNEPEEDAKLSHHPTFRDPDDEPEEPGMPETGETKPAEALVNDLE